MDAIIERYKTECLVEGLSLAEPLDIVSVSASSIFILVSSFSLSIKAKKDNINFQFSMLFAAEMDIKSPSSGYEQHQQLF